MAFIYSAFIQTGNMASIPKYDFANLPVMWKPPKGTISETEKFEKFISEKYNIKIESYWDLYQWSVENPAKFWAEMWKYTKLLYSKPYTQVVDESLGISEMPEWFKGAELNYAENVLRHRDEHTALILLGEEHSPNYVPFSEMYAEVCKYSAALKKLGLRKGDRVAAYMSNRGEALYAMLAANAAGAIWMGALPFYGAKAVLSRFQQTSPKFLFTIDKFLHQGEETEMLSKLQEISEALPSLEKIIIIPSKPSSLEKNISDIKKSCFLYEFLSYGLESDGSVPELDFEQVSFNYPVFISYTSGTTGIPKAIVHGCGVLLSSIQNYKMHSNGTRDDVYLSISPPGWASWNMLTSTLAIGSCLILYEGMPFFLSPTYIWDLIDELKISILTVAPSILNDLEKKNYVPSKKNTLSSLRAMMGTSGVIKSEGFDFVQKKIKPDLRFSSCYGFTEVLGFSMMSDCTLPIYRGEISAPTFGTALHCFDEEGNAIEGEAGELVFTKPFPPLPVGIWNDTDGSKFYDAYMDKYPGVLRIGDLCLINPITKGLKIYGRSDETLKPGGTRFGSSEIYRIVETFPEVEDSLCVSQYNKQRDERAVLFLKISKRHRLTNKLISKIRKAIQKELSKEHVPEIILEAEQIPYNMNGKKMETIIKKIINDMPYNSEAVFNAECLKKYHNIPQLKDY